MRRALAAIPLMLLLTACGGGGDEVSEVSEKDRYLAKAEAICASANDELAAVRKTQPSSTDLLPAFVTSVVDVGRKNVTQLAALTPPAADAAQIQAKVIDPLKAQVVTGDAYAAKVAKAVKDKDPALLGLVTNPPTETKADIAFMKDYGFRACVQAADTGSS